MTKIVTHSRFGHPLDCLNGITSFPLHSVFCYLYCEVLHYFFSEYILSLNWAYLYLKMAKCHSDHFCFVDDPAICTRQFYWLILVLVLVSSLKMQTQHQSVVEFLIHVIMGTEEVIKC